MSPRPSLNDVTDLCDALQQNALSSTTKSRLHNCHLLRVVVLRNSVRQQLNEPLLRRHAHSLKKRVVCWHSQDLLTHGGQLPADITAALRSMPAQKNDGIESHGRFFPGMLYHFIDNESPALHRVKNNGCVGVRLITHPLEPEDTGEGPEWQLMHMPLAIIVRPDGDPPLPSLPTLAAGIPPGCTPVTAHEGTLLTVHLPDHVMHEGQSSIIVKRRGFPLNPAYAVTDYFAEGMTFGNDDTWAIHMTLPPKSSINRASVLVNISRFRGWSHVNVLCPLWRPLDPLARKDVIKRFSNFLKMSDDLVTDLKRLAQLATHTLNNPLPR